MKKSEVHLTQLASAAGCGAKIGPKVLAQVVGKLPKFTDPMLLVGPETSDDAAVYKINDELAMIHTVDFFPPVVDDPYMYGQIAAANALSDVYAMGGVPKLALNVVAFPNCLGPEVLEQILAARQARTDDDSHVGEGDREVLLGHRVLPIVNVLRGRGPVPR